MTSAPIEFQKLPSLASLVQAFPYQGSKRALAHAIVPLIPPDTSALIEPFAGSAAIAVAARHTAAADQVVIADINGPLIALWDRLLDDPTRLADDYEAMWHEQVEDPRGYFDQVRQKFNATPEPHYLLYLLNRCVKAAVRYSRSGNFNQSADHRRLGARPATVRQRVELVSHILLGARTYSGDFQPLLTNADARDVVYMDPPYQGVTNVADHRYVRGLERSDFETSLAVAVANDVSFIVSYDVVTTDNKYGEQLSPSLGLQHLHVAAGRSSQATLNGEIQTTIESLYLSPALVDRLGGSAGVLARLAPTTDSFLFAV